EARDRHDDGDRLETHGALVPASAHGALPREPADGDRDQAKRDVRHHRRAPPDRDPERAAEHRAEGRERVVDVGRERRDAAPDLADEALVAGPAELPVLRHDGVARRQHLAALRARRVRWYVGPDRLVVHRTSRGALYTTISARDVCPRPWP